MSDILKEYFASAPVDIYDIVALDIVFNNKTIRICDGYENMMLGGNEYLASNIAVNLPNRSTTGQQNLTFGIWNATGEVQKLIDEALGGNHSVTAIVYQYLSNDLDSYANIVSPMNVVGGTIQGIGIKIDCSYHDLLNDKYPRETYNDKSSPGIQWL